MRILTTDREAFRRKGWAFVLWGLVAVAFGLAVLTLPELTGTVLITLIGVAVLAIGLVLMYGAWRLREVAASTWWIALLPGLTVAVFGMLVLLFPDPVSTVLLVVLAALAILAGIGDIASGVATASFFGAWWLRVLRGVLLVALGLWVILTPISGLVALGWLVGLWAILLGVVTVVLGALAVRA